ncbi:hypothetical protein [Sphingomonas sp. 8AM]|nr:hypothetical protein [Sphingomonas sp. 8AM]VXC99701.1 hypothetical protein SPHINGO8AM_70103 [Sphingomonas sp. 8AM]
MIGKPSRATMSSVDGGHIVLQASDVDGAFGTLNANARVDAVVTG